MNNSEINKEYLEKIVEEKKWDSLILHGGYVKDSRNPHKEIPLFMTPKEFKLCLDNLYESLERKEIGYDESDYRSTCAANRYIKSLRDKGTYISTQSEVCIRKAAIRDGWGVV